MSVVNVCIPRKKKHFVFLPCSSDSFEHVSDELLTLRYQIDDEDTIDAYRILQKRLQKCS